jgi:hypothetical protein
MRANLLIRQDLLEMRNSMIGGVLFYLIEKLLRVNGTEDL